MSNRTICLRLASLEGEEYEEAVKSGAAYVVPRKEGDGGKSINGVPNAVRDEYEQWRTRGAFQIGFRETAKGNRHQSDKEDQWHSLWCCLSLCLSVCLSLSLSL